MFVVDSFDRERLGEAKTELWQILKDQRLRKDAVLLVFANKQDLSNSLTSDEVQKQLELTSVTDRPWCECSECKHTYMYRTHVGGVHKQCTLCGGEYWPVWWYNMQSLQVSCGYCCCCDACFTSVFCRGITLGCDSGSFGGRELLPLGICTDTWISSSGVWWYIISVLQ